MSKWISIFLVLFLTVNTVDAQIRRGKLGQRRTKDDAAKPVNYKDTEAEDDETGWFGSLWNFGVKTLGIGSDEKEATVTVTSVNTDSRHCNVKSGHIERFVTAINEGNYGKELAAAVLRESRKDKWIAWEVGLHFCRLEYGIPTTGQPEKFRSLDDRSKIARDARYPAGLQPQLEEGWPDDHQKALHGVGATGQVGGHGFQSKNCKVCHEKQWEEWRSSAHARATVDLGFNLFEKQLRENNLATPHQGLGFDGSGVPTTQLCGGCHIGVGQETILDAGPVPLDSDRFLSHAVSEEEAQGISCVTCHTKSGIDNTVNLNLGLTGDGIGNGASLQDFEPHNVIGAVLWGPYPQDEINSPHTSKQWGFATETNHGKSGKGCKKKYDSSGLCLTCHDVRLPTEDTKEGQPFQRLENLATEYGHYREEGGKFTCIECHMTQDPNCKPGVFSAQPLSSVVSQTGCRTNHQFLGITVPLQKHRGRFEDIDSKDLTELGGHLGREQLRECLLRQAATLDAPKEEQQIIQRDGETLLVIEPTVSNTGTGHGIPSGFSQEREVWLKIEVTDDDGNVVYRSGQTWGDIKGKEREEWAKKLGFSSVQAFNNVVVDEDLAHELVVLDPVTMEAQHLRDKEREKIGAEKYGTPSLEKFNNDLAANRIPGKTVISATEFLNNAMDSPNRERFARRYGFDNFQDLQNKMEFAEYFIHDRDNLASQDILYRTGTIQHGPDFPERDGHSKHVNGLRIYTNQFIRNRKDGGEELVFVPGLANHMNNDESLKPFKTDKARYEIPVDPNYQGSYKVKASLNYRAYPPHFFSMLVESERRRAIRESRNPIAGSREYQNAVKTIQMADIEYEVKTDPSKIKLAQKCQDDSLKKVVDLTKRNKSPEDMLLLTSFANTLCQQPEKPDDAQLKCLSNFILGRHLLIGNNGIFGDTDVANDAKKQEEYLKLVQSVCINGDYANRPGDRCISDNYKKYGFQPKYFFNCKNQLEGVIFFVENALKGIDEIQELPPCPNRE